MKNALNNLHPTIKFIAWPAKFVISKKLIINFLNITVYENGYDIFYKEANTYDCLNYNSHHPNHIKRDIPFNLAKCILVLVLDEQKVALQLKDLRKWLLNCNYPGVSY